MLVKLTKVSDNRYNGQHPNGIDKGHTITGYPIENKPIIGHRFIVRNLGRFLSTSLITEIIDKNTFKTENSTYKLEYIKNRKLNKN
jgi:hypothetical protein